MVQVGIFQLSLKCQIVVLIERRIPSECTHNPFINPLEYVERERSGITGKYVTDQTTQGELDCFEISVQLAKARRQIQPLFDQEILDRFLKGVLPLLQECLVIRRSERIPQQNCESRGEMQ